MGALSNSITTAKQTNQPSNRQGTSTPKPQVQYKTPSLKAPANASYFSGGLLSKAIDILSTPTYAFAGFNKAANTRAKEMQADARTTGQTAFQKTGFKGLTDVIGAGFRGILPGIQKRTSFGTGETNYNVASEMGIKEGFGQDAVNLASNIVAPSLPVGALAKTGGAIVSKVAGPTAKVVSGLAGKIPGFSTASNFVKGTAKPGAELATDLIPTQKKLGNVKEFFGRVRNNIGSQGVHGKELADDLQKWRDVGERTAGQFLDRLKPVANLKKEQFDDFVEYAEGRVPKNTLPPTPELQEALAAWDSVRKEIAKISDLVGLKMNTRENYFPHVFDPKQFEGKGFQDAVEHLVKTGQATDVQDAMKKLTDLYQKVKSPKYGNLEFERTVNLPGYRRDAGALFEYVEKASKRLSEAATFGAKYEKAQEKIAKAGMEGYDVNAMKNLFNIAVERAPYGTKQAAASRAIRTANTITKLGLGALTNVGQNVNTAVTTGVLRTIKNIPGAMTKEKKDFALRTGVTLDGVLRDLAEGGGFSTSVLGKAITAPGFNAVEKFNRTLAAWAGKEFADDLAKQAVKGNTTAIRQLEKLGLNPTRIIAQGGKLSLEDQITAARRIVERTQFKVDPQDLPGWASSPFGKIINQFRTFSYNQTAFIKREIYDEAAKGNFQPLIRFAVVAPLVGGSIREIRNVITFRDSESDPKKKIISAYKQAGGLGLAGDLYEGFFPQNSENLSPDRRVTSAIGSVGGPTISTGTEALGAGYRAIEGDYDPAIKLGLKQIPIVGQAVSNIVAPYKKKSTKKTRLKPLPNIR